MLNLKNKIVRLKSTSSAVECGWVLPGERVEIVDMFSICKNTHVVPLYLVETKNKYRVAVYKEDMEDINNE